MRWVTDRYPEPGKDILIYDLMQGIVIGYHDMWSGNKYFFTTNNSPLTAVACWQYLPEKPDMHNTLQDSIDRKSMVIKIHVEAEKEVNHGYKSRKV